MKFPLADWIDSHAGVRHHLGSSGMYGSIRSPVPSGREIRAADAEDLRRRLGDLLDVAPERVFLTHGGTEANSTVMFFLRARRGAGRACRIAYPEYPPLFDGARAAGFVVRDSPAPATLAVVSQPRNPEGNLWSRSRLRRWAEGARYLLVDETFREFSGTRSLSAGSDPRVWTTGSFTKFFAGDDFRVGFAVAPEAEAEAFGRFHGLVTDEVAPFSIASASGCLRAISEVRRAVAEVLTPNRAMWEACFPGSPAPVAPVGFDRHAIPDGDNLAGRCLAASVLVCPGRLFGDPSGVRLTLTRRTFPRDLAAYLAVRDGASNATLPESTPPNRSRARPRRAEAVPGRAGRA